MNNALLPLVQTFAFECIRKYATDYEVQTEFLAPEFDILRTCIQQHLAFL